LEGHLRLDECIFSWEMSFFGGHLRLESSCIPVNMVDGWLSCLPFGCFSLEHW